MPAVARQKQNRPCSIPLALIEQMMFPTVRFITFVRFIRECREGERMRRSEEELQISPQLRTVVRRSWVTKEGQG